jgi:DNA-binding transcriptional regulator LsrR (DeoR family)
MGPRSAVDVDLALELYDQGRSLEEVAAEFLVTRQAVHRILKQHPLYKPRTKTEASHRLVDDARVVELWKLNLPQRAIAERLGISHPTVSRSLRRSGIKARRLVDDELVAELWRQGGRSQASIGRELGVSQQVIGRSLRRSGIDPSVKP